MAHLPGWKEFPFEERLAARLQVPTALRNDAELAALGEAHYGAGKGYALVGYAGIGTGVGGALIYYGRPAPHAASLEPGHQILDVETGATFEDLVSGSGLKKLFGAAAKDLSRDVYDERTPFLAAGLYNLILEWSPDVLVLGGSLVNDTNGYRLKDIEQALRAIPTTLPHLPPLRLATLGDENGLCGALALAST